MSISFRQRAVGFLLVAVLVGAIGCGDDGGGSLPANEVVRRRIDSLAPAANIGHRGTGVTRPGHSLPENSIASFIEAMAQGADGVELDVELTADGALIVMHNDTVDSTTTCTGRVCDWTLAEVRECFLVDGAGRPTSESPPTLEEVYQALPRDALVNVELKTFKPPCLTDDNGAAALARAAVNTVRRLGVEARTLFSSFDSIAAAVVKEEDPTLYSALLVFVADDDTLEHALDLGLDAIHPLHSVTKERVRAMLDAGLQVNVWTVNSAERMNQALDKGVTAIITDEPALLDHVMAAPRGATHGVAATGWGWWDSPNLRPSALDCWLCMP